MLSKAFAGIISKHSIKRCYSISSLNFQSPRWFCLNVDKIDNSLITNNVLLKKNSLSRIRLFNTTTWRISESFKNYHSSQQNQTGPTLSTTKITTEHDDKSKEFNNFIIELEKLNNDKPIEPIFKNILRISGYKSLSSLSKFDFLVVMDYIEKNKDKLKEKFKIYDPEFTILSLAPGEKEELRILIEFLQEKVKEKLEEKIKQKEIAEKLAYCNSNNVKTNDKMIPFGDANIIKVFKSGFYIDKTEDIYNLIKFPRRVIISRPRRFGKSLCIDTIELIFSGGKDIFKKYNCYISKAEYDWKIHPVIRFDFSKLQNQSMELFEKSLIHQIKKNATKNRVELELNGNNSILLFSQLIEKIENKDPVVLIDEYDSPINGLQVNSKSSDSIVETVKAFFTTLKSCDSRLVFVTGVCKIALAGIGSGANDLTDMSMSNEISTLFGFTEAELKSTYGEELCKQFNTSSSELDTVLKSLKEYYNGYRFSKSTTCVINPWALLNCLKLGKISPYWSRTADSTVLIKTILNYPEIFKLYMDNPSFDITENELMANRSCFDKIDFVQLLFQFGYLTIKGYDIIDNKSHFKLGYPNQEVKENIESILNKYLYSIEEMQKIKNESHLVRQALLDGNIQKFINYIIEAYATRSFYQKTINESHIHNLLLMLLKGICDGHSDMSVRTEPHNSEGRSDLTLFFNKMVCIIELKHKLTITDEQAKNDGIKAIEQIVVNEYYQPYIASYDTTYALCLVFSDNAKIRYTEWIKLDDITIMNIKNKIIQEKEYAKKKKINKQNKKLSIK